MTDRTDGVDCLVFEDQLDAFVRGALSEEGEQQLRAHAAQCSACATSARIGAHLASPTLEELEGRVPDAWVRDMGTEVEATLRARQGAGGRPRRWVVPTLAAASVALLLSTGWAMRALDRAADREQALVGQLLDQQRRLVALGDAALPAGRRAGVGEARAASLRSLGVTGRVTVAELRVILEDLPSGTPVVSASRTARLATSRLVPTEWREALLEIQPAGDVTVADLLALLDQLDLPSEASVPAGRLFELLS